MQDNFSVRSAATLIATSMLAALLVACGGNGALDARAAAPEKTNSQPLEPDPALGSLEGVTHHG